MPTNILLLQGPVGPFFKRWSRQLTAQGHRVYKINFNGGDSFFYPGKNSINYSDTLEAWPDFLQSILLRWNIDRIYVFGDCRAYHVIAAEKARKMGLTFSVFEEGYLRPDYITLEEGGVNGNSSLCHENIRLKPADSSIDMPKHISHSFLFSSLYSIIYYIASSLSRKKFPEYQHHRPLNIWSEGKLWLKGFARKLKYKITEHQAATRILQANTPYFLVPLQVHADMQVRQHSDFDSIENFICQVVHSFSRSADTNCTLVFKHHPLDRGYKNYSGLIKLLEELHGIHGRIIYLHDWHLPTLLKNARGTVTINSTVGISSLHHGTPVKTLGKAIYNIEGLCSQNDLSEFWQQPGKVDKILFNQFRRHLLQSNQINGNFYRPAPQSRNASGLHIPEALLRAHDIQNLPPRFEEAVTSH